MSLSDRVSAIEKTYKTIIPPSYTINWTAPKKVYPNMKNIAAVPKRTNNKYVAERNNLPVVTASIEHIAIAMATTLNTIF